MSKLNKSAEEIKFGTGDVLYSWDARTPSIYFGDMGKYIQWGIPLLCFIFLCGMGISVFNVMPVFISFYFVFCIFLVLIYRYTTFSDYCFHYELYSTGIKIVRWQVIPSWLVKLIRIMSWFSILIVMLSVIIVGPLALAGGAIFIFSLFKFCSYSGGVKTWFTPKADSTIIFYLRKNSYAVLYSYPYKIELCAQLFINRENKDTVLTKLKKFTNCELYEVNSEKEKNIHPRKQDIVNTVG